MRIAISGAGIAGPTLAWWLLRAGHEVTLIEQAPALRTGGYIIDFWGTGYTIAERMGLLPRVREAGYQVEEVRFVGEDGRRVSGFSTDVFVRMTGGRFTSLPRGTLGEIIWEALEGRAETLFGDSIAQVEQGGKCVRLTTGFGVEREVDMLVGADGLHSNVRALAFGEEAGFERPLGYYVAAVQAPGYEPRDPLVYMTYGRPGRQVARFAERDGSSLILFVFTADRLDVTPPDGPDAAKAALRQVFAGMGWEVPHMLAAMDEVDEVYFDRVSQIVMPRWSEGRVVLLGDAAACVSLLAGEGSSLAMTEAYVLVGELTRARGDVHVAAAAYERRLRPLLEAKQKSARKFAGAFAPHTALGIGFRNFVSRLLAFRPVADYFVGRDLRDDFELPDYGL